MWTKGSVYGEGVEPMSPSAANVPLTRRQVKNYSNILGCYLLNVVGLRVEDACAVLSRKVCKRQLQKIRSKTEPVFRLPDPYERGTAPLRERAERAAQAARRDNKRRKRPPLPKRCPAGRGRIITSLPTTSATGSESTAAT